MIWIIIIEIQVNNKVELKLADKFEIITKKLLLKMSQFPSEFGDWVIILNRLRIKPNGQNGQNIINKLLQFDIKKTVTPSSKTILKLTSFRGVRKMNSRVNNLNSALSNFHSSDKYVCFKLLKSSLNKIWSTIYHLAILNKLKQVCGMKSPVLSNILFSIYLV